VRSEESKAEGETQDERREARGGDTGAGRWEPDAEIIITLFMPFLASDHPIT
jgi:hypothetical protein